jgi:hypothetical protein
MAAAWTEPESSRYAKRLAIIVPYRDRAEHLALFVPHMLTYFERDKLDRHIAFSIHIVEQHGHEPFNRGKLLNCGYSIARGADYFCFHDVDYLPIWADYSWSPNPARLIWHGLRLQEDPQSFFGAVTLFDTTVFEALNGYPNGYWGWGFEDAEMRLRCVASALDFERRDGTYQALPHPHAGYLAPGIYTEEAKRNSAFFDRRRAQIAELIQEDGLRSLSFERLETRTFELGGVPLPNVFRHLVKIGKPR